MIGQSDYFGSEADQMAGSRRGFGTIGTQGLSPSVPTLPNLSGGSTSTGAPNIAPPTLPSSYGNASGSSIRLAAPPVPTAAPMDSSPRIGVPTPPAGGPQAGPPQAGGVVNGWAPPAGIGAGSAYALPGFDQSKWMDPNKGNTDLKYLIGHLLSSFSATTAPGLQQVVDTLNRMGHQASYSGSGDLITVDGTPIDAVRNFGGADATPQYLIPGSSSGAGYGVSGTDAGGVAGAGGVGGAAGTPGSLSGMTSAGDAFTDPATQFLEQFVQTYMGNLLAPPYTDPQAAAIKASSFNSLEADRQSEIQNAKEQLGAMGVAPTSGVVAATINSINAKYDQLRASGENTFATQAIGRSDTRQQQALSLAGLLADLPVQRLQVAEQAAGMGTNPASFFNQLLGFAQSGQNAAYQQQQLQQQYGLGLGQILGSVAGNFAPAVTAAINHV